MTESERHIALHQQLREARRRAGMTQSALARAVECQQSAISMMERGNLSALAKETLARIAETLGVTMPERTESALPLMYRVGTARCYCPVYDCPTNLPYVVSGVLLFRPRFFAVGCGPYCAHCGELLESSCPACGASVGDGACCYSCGTGYVSVEGVDVTDPVAWADMQRGRITTMLNTP